MKIAAFSKTFDGRKVLDFPGMDLEPGNIYAVIGANGSGKSTFSKILAGVLKADRRGKWLEGGTVGYMPQKNYPFRMTTRANILLNGMDVKRAEHLMDACLTRLGVRDYFEFLLSCETVGAGKRSPIVYHTSAQRLNAMPQEIAVYEDALYAIQTAKKAGYYVVGVYDDSAADSWQAIEEMADEIIHWEETT